jgi:hypothetical protein
MSAEGNLPPARGSQRAGFTVVLAIAAFCVGAVAFAAGWMLGARRIVMTESSPGRDAVAYVAEGRCSGGTCQTLWVGPTARDARRVEGLTADERADEIAWTPDGGRVAFLVNGYQLRVFDAHTGQNLGAVALLDPDRSPSSRIARGVTFSNNGAAVTFDDCPRDQSGCRPGLIALKLTRQ